MYEVLEKEELNELIQKMNKISNKLKELNNLQGYLYNSLKENIFIDKKTIEKEKMDIIKKSIRHTSNNIDNTIIKMLIEDLEK